MAIIHSFTGQIHVFYGLNSHRTVPGPTATPSRLGNIVLRRFRRWHHSPIPCRKCPLNRNLPVKMSVIGGFRTGSLQLPTLQIFRGKSLFATSIEQCSSRKLPVHSHGGLHPMIVHKCWSDALAWSCPSHDCFTKSWSMTAGWFGGTMT